MGFPWLGSLCCCSSTCRTTICLSACSAVSVVGATVQIRSGGSVIASGTTTAGCVTLSIPSAGTYDVRYQIPGESLVDAGNKSLTCGGTTTITVSSHPSHICCGNCLVPSTLTLTDALSTCTLTFNGISGGWGGLYTLSTTCLLITNIGGGVCTCAIGTGTIRVTYLLKCNTSTSTPAFNIGVGFEAACPSAIGGLPCITGTSPCYLVPHSYVATPPGCGPTINIITTAVSVGTTVPSSSCGPSSFSWTGAASTAGYPISGNVTVTN